MYVHKVQANICVNFLLKFKLLELSLLLLLSSIRLSVYFPFFHGIVFGAKCWQNGPKGRHPNYDKQVTFIMPKNFHFVSHTLLQFQVIYSLLKVFSASCHLLPPWASVLHSLFVAYFFVGMWQCLSEFIASNALN